MSAKLMGLVWDLDLSHSLQSVLLAYADHADQNGENIFPGQNLIAWKTGYSLKQVKRITSTLVAQGLLVSTRKGLGRGNKSVYSIDLTKGDKKAPFNEWVKGDISDPEKGTFQTVKGDISDPPYNHDQPVLNHKPDSGVRKLFFAKWGQAFEHEFGHNYAPGSGDGKAIDRLLEANIDPDVHIILARRCWQRWSREVGQGNTWLWEQSLQIRSFANQRNKLELTLGHNGHDRNANNAGRHTIGQYDGIGKV